MESNGGIEVPVPAISEGATAHVDKESISQAVKVAVHIRPLIGPERLQGCKDCITVVPGEPQVQIGNHTFTFDHVYGSTGSPSAAIFEECVEPLVEGLFHGYNATVLAYGQTGSGKTYTMGTAYTVGGSTEGVIPQVMEMIFKKAESLQDTTEFQLRVSFIEILKEEVHDLLDPNPPTSVKPEMLIGFGLKPTGPVKPPIQIRETSNGGITLAGVTETDVRRLEEMAACLEQGSLCRATASTNMNSRSSRSHAIFTITLEQKQKWDLLSNGDSPLLEETSEDFLCAKLHLVDLAGSERAKRTGADGLRFKEGVHINKGLLALGNVISALGDDKKRKEGGHVPYRDSKLTRLLQDSLGGNSRTVMIACVSPADSNAEETLNTLKYANRARNIQNKPIVNRDPMAAEMQRMRQQLDLLQAELLYMREGPGSSDDTQMLKQKNGWLEATISDLRQELEESRQRALDAQVERDKLHLKLESLRSGKSLDELDNGSEAQGVGMLQTYAVRIQELESEMRQLRDSNSQDFVASKTYATLPCTNDSIVATGNYAELPEGIEAVEAEETAAKELEHTIRQDFMDKELQELNKKLEQKEAEMKTFSKYDGVILKQHFEKKIVELEEEKVALQRERDCLLAEVEKLASVSDDQTQKMQEAYMQKLKALESQIAELKNKQENQAQLLKQKQRSDEAAKRLQDEIQRIKTQKVQLQHKIKQESEQFRFWKASREKEVLQLKKEGRRNEYEMHKLQALHQRQKMVLQRKTEEAALATRRLKELLEARKPSPRDLSLTGSASTNRPSGQMNEKSIQQLLDHELEVAVHIHGVRSNYEKQTHSRAALAKELAQLKQEEDMKQKSSTGIISVSMSPGARSARIRLLESMLNASSSTLVAMASQLSEAEEQERAFSGRGRWQHLRTMGDAKNLLQYIFDTTTYARCQLWDNALEIKELKEKITELTDQLRQSEAYKKDIDRKQYLRDQAVARPLSTGKVNLDGAVVKRGAEDLSISVSQSDGLGLCQPQYLDSCPGFSSGGMPYDLRKAPRGYSYAHHDDMESTDGDIDMDIDDDGDQSDEDWNEEGERRVMKTRGGGEQRGRVSRTGIRAPLSVDSNPGCGSALDQHGHECLGHPSGEGENGNRETQSNPEKERCCSCSQSSSCKTKKCECKAAGDLCGPSCRCKASKCANREIVNGEAELSSASSTNQAEVAEAMATLKLDRANRWNYGKGDAIQSDRFTGDDVVGVDEVKHAEEVLARHGVALLENVWKDEKIENSHSHLDMKGDESGIQEKGNQRRPLTDIGNTKVSAQLEGHPTVKQRKRWQKKVLVQIVPVAPHTNAFDPVTAYQPDLARSESASEIAVPSSTETAVIGAIDTNVVTSVRAPTNNSEAHSTAMDRVASLSVKLPMNGRKKSSQSSPLRARNMHSAEDAGVSKKLGNGPASPRGSGRGTEEKENV